MDITRLSVSHRVMLGAMAVVAIAAFLPWVGIFGESILGIEGDGVLTLVFAIAGIALLVATSGMVGSKPKSVGKFPRIALLVLGTWLP